MAAACTPTSRQHDIREKGGEEVHHWYLRKIQAVVTKDHIAAYGSDNDQRLTGLHETQAIDTSLAIGVSDRGASIRIPVGTVQDGWKGYLEDRRPASNADPYKVVGEILATLRS